MGDLIIPDWQSLGPHPELQRKETLRDLVRTKVLGVTAEE